MYKGDKGFVVAYSQLRLQELVQLVVEVFGSLNIVRTQQRGYFF